MTCSQCNDRGLVKICYQSGEPFDVAMCRCRAGQPWRDGGALLVRAQEPWIPETAVIAWLEDFNDEPVPEPVTRDYLQVGQTQPRAKL
jgi:hypothetical protein